MKTKKIKETKVPSIFRISTNPYGIPYVKWTEKWWQWAFSIPKSENPILDKSGMNCKKGQNGRVWYLAGTTGNETIAKRTCSMPQNKAILFPLIVTLFSHSEKTDLNRTELIQYTAKDMDLTTSLRAVVDGTPLTNLSRYRVKSYFDLNLVKDNIWGVQSGPTQAASDGFWVFLKPLSEGNHTIKFEGVEPNFKTRVSYNIKVL